MSPHLSEEDRAHLAEAGLFAGLPEAARDRLLDGAALVRPQAHQALFAEGDAADRFFVLLDGRIKLFRLTEDGEELVVDVLAEPQTFGEAAMFLSRDFPVSAEAVGPARLLTIPAAPFLRRLEEDRDLAAQVLAGMAGHYRRLAGRLALLKGTGPAGRVAAWLLDRVAESGAVVSVPVNKALLARQLGMTPETFSRALKRLQAAGVTVSGRTVTVSDPAALAAVRDGAASR